MRKHGLPRCIAIYARYSSDLQNPSSVDDQVALCRSVITQHFAPTDPRSALVFSDAAITGSTMERPGLLRLMRAVEAKRIDLVVAEGLDRVSRSLKDIAGLYERMAYHGVGMWTVHEGHITELHIGLKGTMNQLMLRDLKAKVRRGQSARVAAGYSASSCPYGYRVVRGVVDGKGRTVNGVRAINEAQAEVVRRVFADFVGGAKIPQIVEALNRDEIPSPSGGLWKRNAIAGSLKRQEGILCNEVYIGNLIYNRTRIVRDPVSGKKRYICNPEEEWTRTAVPALRIIADDLWQKAQRRLRERKQAEKPRKTLGTILNSHNQHALTGWVKCGACGGPKSLANASRYLCSTHRYAKKCANARGTTEAVLMAATFRAIRKRIEQGGFRAPFSKAFAKDLAKQEDLARREADTEAGIRRLLTAVEKGVDVDQATARILELQADLATIRQKALSVHPVVVPEEAAIAVGLLRAVANVDLNADVVETRQMFKALLKEVVLTPVPGQRSGETIAITLREDGWPTFWREFASGHQTAPAGG
ncbi:recombinase family protein [Magnetospirillum sp. UT-4]|uniref:recombinase family protein n=1 Tax=Magnetospirillum sp. UT-4 TaxID=2681467 RepID=UPI0013808D89|nr:recombinase family protein [Magnetospirillum sp. UT-4]CAA7619283.1 Recombinase [Magnetospirillum sp. UT-4]